MKLTVFFRDCWEGDTRIPESDRWLAWLEEMPGMVVSGESKQNVFDELMISLRVKILYDSNLRTFDLK